MAEEKDKRETWLGDELHHSISDISVVTKPSSPGPTATHFFCEPNNYFIGPSDIDQNGMVINRSYTKMGWSCSLKRVVSLERLQKRMHGGSSSCDLNQWGASMQ
jgi:Basic leucine-zipper C terminal